MGSEQQQVSTFKSELYQPRFEADWHRHILYNLAEWVNGLSFRNTHFSPQGKPIIKIAEIKNGISGQTKFTKGEHDAIYHVTEGEMLFSWSGQPETSIDVFIWKGPDGWLNQHIFKVNPKEDCDGQFFFYLLKYLNPNFVRIARNKQTTGLGHVTKKDLQNISVKLPSFGEQRAIAHILGSLDDKIELNRRMNKALEATARAIFKSWFVDFDPVRAKAEGRPTGLPDDIAALFPDSFEESELGEIPKGWEGSTIGENAEKLSKGTTPRKNDVLNAQDTPSIPFLKVRNISDEGEIDLSKLDRIPRSIHQGFLKRSILKTNDVLFSIAGTIGRVSILHEELNDSNANQAIAFVRPKKNELPSTFIRLILISDRIQYEASSRVVQGVQANVSLTVLSELKFAKPPQSIIDIWLRYFGDSFSRQELLLRESRSLSALRDTLLPKLISGELRVPDAERFVEEAGI